jgi:2'-5' RNA ligase
VDPPERRRLFVAADVPLQQRIAVRDAVMAQGAPGGVRWAAAEGQHVTLKFLGWTSPDRIEALGRALRLVARGRTSAPVAIDGIGCFPSARRARVLWAGLVDPHGLLSGLAADLDRALEPLGYPAEARPFTPHLTLARFRSPVGLQGRYGSPPWRELPPFELRSFNLYRSHLSPRGARYEVLKKFPLGSPRQGDRADE